MDSTSSSPSLCLSLSTLSRATSSTITPQQKLKNACDLCSTFKIRCDKGKPSCGRCANLGQPCSYSPARRAGRPHRLRQQQHQQQQHQHQQRLPEQQEQQEQQRQQQLDSLLNITSSCFNDQPVSFAAGDFDWGNYDHDPDHDWGMQLELPAALSDATVTSSSRFSQIPETPRAPSLVGHNHSMVFTTTNKPDSATQIPLSNLQNQQINQQIKEQPPSSPAANTSQVHPPRSSSRSEGGRTLTGDGDCAQMAAFIIEQSSSCSSFNMTSSHCQRLLTILVCPCSEQPVVALLVASACIALMDAVLHQQQAPADETFPVCLSKPSPRHHHSHSLPLPAFTSLNNYSLSDQGEFEVLAKIAKVVLRFTQRYGQYEGPGGGGGPGGGTTRALLEPIVILLRSKLQFVTEEATGMQLNRQLLGVDRPHMG